MLKGVSKILAAAVAVLAIPAASQAASVVLSYTTVQYSQSSTFASGVTTVAVPAAGGTVAVPNAGYYLRFNVSATVVGDNNAAFAAADPSQPTVLGLASFGANVTSSVAGAASPVNTTGVAIATGSTSSAVVNSVFGTTSKGVVAADGSIGTGALANLIAGGNVAGSIDNTDGANNNKLTVGTGTGSTLFTGVRYLINGSTTLTAILPTTSMAFVTTGAAGVPPTYANRNFAATDTLTGPGNLVIVTPEPTSLAVLGIAGASLMARRRKA